MTIAGTWKVTMDTPMGSQDMVVQLDVHGDRLTGTMSAPQGELEISEGSTDGTQGSWSAALTQPVPITLEFTAKAEGDEISGDVKLGSFGNASFSGSRA